MPIRFEFFGQSEPQARTFIEKSLTRDILELREKLSQISVEVPSEITRWEEYQCEKYQKEWEELGGKDALTVPVYHIPRSQFSKLAELLPHQIGNVAEDLVGGFYDSTSGAVVVIQSEKSLSLYGMQMTAHELAHAYCQALDRYKVTQEGTNLDVSMTLKGGGMIRTNDIAKFGAFFEEWYAVERELEAASELEKFFPERVKVAKAEIAAFANHKDIPPEDRPYIAVEDSNEKHVKLRISLYAQAHRMGSKIMEKIPNGKRILMRSRVTGDFSEFARAINNHLGPDSFKIIMHIDPEDSFARELLESFLEAQSSEERSQIGKRIMEYKKSKAPKKIEQ